MKAGIEFLFWMLLFAGLGVVCLAYWLRAVINHLIRQRKLVVIREGWGFQHGRVIRADGEIIEIERTR